MEDNKQKRNVKNPKNGHNQQVFDVPNGIFVSNKECTREEVIKSLKGLQDLFRKSRGQ